MNSSDWKEFEKEKPKEGQLVLLTSDQRHIRIATYHDCGEFYNWWQPWADPPKPDPFDSWYRQWILDGHPTGTEQSYMRRAWNAAMKWAREHPEEK